MTAKFTNQEVVLIAQESPWVVLWTRDEEGNWTTTTTEGLGSSVYLASIQFTLLLSDLYRRIKFTAPPLHSV